MAEVIHVEKARLTELFWQITVVLYSLLVFVTLHEKFYLYTSVEKLQRDLKRKQNRYAQLLQKRSDKPGLDFLPLNNRLLPQCHNLSCL